MLKLAFAVPVVASLLLGCGGGKASTPTPGSSATGADFCSSLVEIYTSVVTRCFGGPDSLWRDFYGKMMNCAQASASLAEGKLVYDSAKGGYCLKQLSGIDCNSPNEVNLDACVEAVAGHVSAGNACTFQNLVFSDCAPGSYCYTPSDTCGGTCQAYVQVGGSCAYTTATGSPNCASGSSCQPNTDLCVTHAAEGQPCLGPSAGDCGNGLYCDGDASTAGTCRKSRTSGACTSGFECEGLYECMGPANARTCTKMKMPGDACTPGQHECYFLFGYCGSDNKCITTHAQENQPCNIDLNSKNELVQCESGLTCIGSSTSTMGTCRKEKLAGAPCTPYSVECAGTGAYCDPKTSLCVSCD